MRCLSFIFESLQSPNAKNRTYSACTWICRSVVQWQSVCPLLSNPIPIHAQQHAKDRAARARRRNLFLSFSFVFHFLLFPMGEAKDVERARTDRQTDRGFKFPTGKLTQVHGHRSPSKCHRGVSASGDERTNESGA